MIKNNKQPVELSIRLMFKYDIVRCQGGSYITSCMGARGYKRVLLNGLHSRAKLKGV